MADVSAIASCLQATLLPDQQQRQAAELQLQEAAMQPGYSVALFRLAVDNTLQAEPVLRQTASVHMKNMINRRWDPPSKPLRGGEHIIAIPEADKASIRDNLVEAMCVALPQVRVQLGTCLRAAAHADYPDKWPTLLSTICANLNSAEPARLHGGLFSLRVLAKVHQYRRERVAPLHQLVAETFPLLLNLMRSILGAPPSVANSELALLAAKTMWSCTQIDMPPLLLQPQSVEQWFEILLALLGQPLPSEGAPSDPEDAAKWPPWKVKKRVAQIMHRVLQRYGNPAAAKEKAEESVQREGGGGAIDLLAGAVNAAKGGDVVASSGGDQAAIKAKQAALTAFARAFQDAVSGKCLQAALSLLQRVHRNEVLPGRVHMLCISYIEEAIKYKTTYLAILKPQVEALFREVIYPPLCFSAADAEQWENDPQEYVRRSLDVIEEYYSPRAAAQNLLIALTTARAKDSLHSIVSACSQILGASLNTSDVNLLMQKDGALLALGSLRKHLTKKAEYKGSLEPMLRVHVLPMLSSEHGFMRQRAAWIYSQFSGTIFRKCGKAGNGEAPSGKGDVASAQAVEQMQQVFPLVIGGLRDRDLPVRVQAAQTIKELVEQECMPPSVIELLPQLMELLFKLLQEVGADEIVATVDTLIEHYGEQMVPYAVQVVGALAQSFMRLVDESDEEDEDDATLAALGVMQALGTMMEAISGKAEVYRQMEAPLMPLFARCCEQDAEDYFEEMLELLNYVVYYAESISPQLWSLVPKLHSIYHDWGREYLNQLGNCLDSFITRSPEAFLTINNGQLVQSIVSICRDALISDEAKESMQDYDQHGAPKLVESMLHACRGRIDPIVPDLITFVLMRLDTCESRSLKILLYSALSSAIHYNPVIALQVLEHRQATQAVLTVWAQHLGAAPKLRVHDLKVGMLAAASLLSVPTAQAPPAVHAGRLHLLRLGVSVAKRIETLREAKKADEEAEDDDDDDDEEEDDSDDGLYGQQELEDEDEGGKPMDTHDALARLLRHAAGDNALKKFNLSALTGDDDGSDASSDELSDDEDGSYDCAIDNYDEFVCLMEAAQAASNEDGDLLAKAGMATKEGVPCQLSEEEVTALRTTIAAGVERKNAPPQQQQ